MLVAPLAVEDAEIIDLASTNPGSGTNYTYSDDVYTINNGANVILTGSTTNKRVVIDATANITLSGASISASTQNVAALDVTGATANIKLKGTNTLTSGENAAGLQVPDGAAVTIDSAAGIGNTDGSLTATGGLNGAGIGGGNDQSGGDITIAGGTITLAQGGDNGAGIGGGYGQSGGNITINGGTITFARSGHYAAGIGGGGNGGSGGNITINGGTITAGSSGDNRDAENGAGIGGGIGGSGGKITINGGTITLAKSGYKSAGIGSGEGGEGSDITISGGIVNATVWNNDGRGAGIGSGYSGAGSNITISGGAVNAKAGYGAGIGGGNIGQGNSTINVTGGIVEASSSYGAGIGSGQNSTGNSVHISISGGIVYASSSTAGAGIGSGLGSNESDVIISIGGGVVTAIASWYGQSIGQGSSGANSASFNMSNNAVVIARTVSGKGTKNGGLLLLGDGSSTFYSDTVMPTDDVAYPPTSYNTNPRTTYGTDISYNLTIPSGKTLNIAEGKQFRINHIDNYSSVLTVASGGKLDVSGALLTETQNTLSIAGELNLTGSGTFENKGALTVASGGDVDIASGTTLTHSAVTTTPLNIMPGGEVNASGTLAVADSSKVNVWGNLSVPDGGTLTNNGEVVVKSGSTVDIEGTLGGSNKINGAPVEAPPEISDIQWSENETVVTLPVVPLAAQTGQTVEYAYSEATAVPSDELWNEAGVFNDLDPSKTYYFFARSKEGTNFKAGASKYEKATADIDLSDPNPPAVGIGWKYDDETGVYTVLDGAEVIIMNDAPENTRRVVVDREASYVDITLSNAAIDVSGMAGAPAFEALSGANAIVKLYGANTLKSGQNAAGLQAPDGSSVTIRSAAGAGTDGTLNAQGGLYGAGIGGGNGQSGGDITINSGTVTATAKDGVTRDKNNTKFITGGGAGIGGGDLGGAGKITITGGKVTAQGGHGGLEMSGDTGGAGIGGGHAGVGDMNITITGGTVDAAGHGFGAGIGCGGGDGNAILTGSINISGGVVNAAVGADRDSNYTSGIGGGSGGVFQGSINISGGVVNATCSDNAYAIGNGRNTNRKDEVIVNVSGGVVYAKNKKTDGGNPDFGGIGTGLNTNRCTFNLNGSGVVFLQGTRLNDNNYVTIFNYTRGLLFNDQTGKAGALYDDGSGVTPTEDLTIPAKYSLTVPSGKTLGVRKDKSLAIEGGLTVDKGGKISAAGDLTFATGAAIGDIAGSIEVAFGGGRFTPYSGLRVASGGAVDISGIMTVPAGTASEIDVIGAMNLKAGGTLTNNSRIDVSGSFDVKGKLVNNGEVVVLPGSKVKVEGTREGNLINGAPVDRAPSVVSTTAVSMTLKPVGLAADTGQYIEYNYSTTRHAPSTGWQIGTSFVGLDPGVTYYIFARSQGNNDFKPGEARWTTARIEPTGAFFVGPSFDPANTSADGSKPMKLNKNPEAGGSAPRLSGDGAINLTWEGWQANSAFLARPIYSETGFSSMFEIYMGDGTESKADGWSFIVAKDANVAGRSGGGLGYVGIPNSFALGYSIFAGGSPELAPAIDFGKDGVFENKYTGSDDIDPRKALTFKPGEKDVPFTAEQVNNLVSKGAVIPLSGALGGASKYSLYGWVDYSVDYDTKKDKIDIYLNIIPEKPEKPIIHREQTGMPDSIGDTYYIGFAAATGGYYQEIDLRQFYVLNNCDPSALQFGEGGKGLNPQIPLEEDFTPPTLPIITQEIDKRFTFGGSQDQNGVKKYQYRYSKGGSNGWTAWMDYKNASGGFDLSASTRIQISDLMDGQSRVEARAIDRFGNISDTASYRYQNSPIPVLSLAAPAAKKGGKVRYQDARLGVTLYFSQSMDISKPGRVSVVETEGGDGKVTLAAITANDPRWKATTNKLELQLEGVQPGATYAVSGAGFVSASKKQQAELTAPFTYSVMGQVTPPAVSIDYENEELIFGGVTEPTAFSVNGRLYVTTDTGRLSLAGDGYDGIGKDVSILRLGDGTNTDDSEPADLRSIPKRPEPPKGLSSLVTSSGVEGWLFYSGGDLATLEYTLSTIGPGREWTTCASDGSIDDRDYMIVTPGATLYVRTKASNDRGNFYSGDTSVRIADKSVTINLAQPDFGHIGYGEAQRTRDIPITAYGNTTARIQAEDVTISQGEDAPFELIVPDGSLDASPTGSAVYGIRVRTKENISVGEHKATVTVKYKFFDGVDMTDFISASTDFSVLVTEAKPQPAIDYVQERIVNLVGGASYIIDGKYTYHSNFSDVNSGPYLVIKADDHDWFGRGYGNNEPLQIQLSNVEDDVFNSEPVFINIENRPDAPKLPVSQETYTDFLDSVIQGVTTDMEFSSDGAVSWLDLDDYDLGGRFDAAAHTIRGLPHGDYYLRNKASAEEKRFASERQRISIERASSGATYKLNLLIDDSGTYAFQEQHYKYASVGLRPVTLRNDGNQTLHGITATLSGASPSAFELSGDVIESLAPGHSDGSTFSVKPKLGLPAGEYRAYLELSAPYSDPASSGAVKAGYHLYFKVKAASITGFETLDDWYPGVENTDEIINNLGTGTDVAYALLQGISKGGLYFQGYTSVTAILEGGGREVIPLLSWGFLSVPEWDPRQANEYTFTGVLDGKALDDNHNINNLQGKFPQVDVVLGDLHYGITLDKSADFSFTEANYGYRVGSGAGEVHPETIAIRNIGSKEASGLFASLSGKDAASFELSNGSSTSQTVLVNAIASEGAVSHDLKVLPKAGLLPETNTSKTYHATVTVLVHGGVSRSFDVSFTVNLGRITTFEQITLDGGRTGFPDLGDDANSVATTLHAIYPSVSAVCADGRTATYFPLDGWENHGAAYDKDRAGTYNFRGLYDAGDVPDYFTVNEGTAPPNISVTIVQTVDVAAPSISQSSGDHNGYTSVADPDGDIILRVSAFGADTSHTDASSVADGVLSYQWYKADTRTNVTGTAIPGATSHEYTVPRGSVGMAHYFCVVTNTNPNVNGIKQKTATSSVSTVTIAKRDQWGFAINDPGNIFARESAFEYGLTSTGGNGVGDVTFEKIYGSNSVATVSSSGVMTVKKPGDITVRATKDGDDDWNAVTSDLPIHIIEKEYTLIRPTKAAIYGQTLGAIRLGHVEAQDGMPAGTWAWKTTSAAVGDVGHRSHAATFTPSNAAYGVSDTNLDVYVSPKLATITGISFGDKHYDGTTAVAIEGEPRADGLIEGDAISVNTSNVKWAFVSPSDAASVMAASPSGVNMAVNRTGDYRLVGDKASNYTLSQPVGPFSAYIKPGFDAAGHYTTSLNGFGATRGAFIVRAKAGYKVSIPIISGSSLTDPGHGGAWADAVTLSDAVTKDAIGYFYERRVGDDEGGISKNEISRMKGVRYTIDRTPPTASVSYNESGFYSFMNTLTLGLFFKDKLEIALKGDDTISTAAIGVISGAGIEGLYYYIENRSEHPGQGIGEGQYESIPWKLYDDGAKPRVESRGKIHLYVKALDKAGNYTIYKDSVVIYSNAHAITERLDFVKTTTESLTAIVRLNDNTISKVKYGSQALTPSGVGVTDDVIDIVGDNITFYASYLDTFAASPTPYALTVEYHPLGVTEPAISGRGDTPSATAIDLYVSKHAQTAPSVSIGGLAGNAPPVMTGGVATDGSIDTSYGVAPFMLSAVGSESSNSYVWTVSPHSGPVSLGTTSAEGNSSTTVSVTGIGRSVIHVYKGSDDDYLTTPTRNIVINIKDAIAPTPGAVGSSSTVSAIARGENDVYLSWHGAADDISTGDKIRYYVYKSESPWGVNSLKDLEEIEDNGGDPITSGYGITATTASGLKADTSYWFNVVAEDESHNKSFYTAANVYTPLNITYAAIQADGVPGKITTSGIRIDFNTTIAGFAKMSPVTVSGAASKVTTEGGIKTADDRPNSRIVKVDVTGDNGEAAYVDIHNWTDPASHRNFIVKTGQQSVDVYRPVPYDTPAARIDFVKEHITNLTPGGLYQFTRDGGMNWGGTISAIQDGDDTNVGYWTMPFSQFGGNIGILRVAGSEARTDSPVQTLFVPLRPTTPAILITQPAIGATYGSITVTNAALIGAGYKYEYAEVTEGSIHAIGSSVKWEDFPSNSPNRLTNLKGGHYRVRVKAARAQSSGEVTTPGNFASPFVTATIHGYGEVRFDPQLQGYDINIPALTPQAVKVSHGTVAAVTWHDDEDFDNKDSRAFYLTKSSITGKYTIQPKVGLSCVTYPAIRSHFYHAKIDVAVDVISGEASVRTTVVQDVWFTVHPNAVIDSAVASSTRSDGMTDRVTVSFRYPTDLTNSAIQVGKAAVKSGSGFQEDPADFDRKQYTIAVTPRTHLNEAIYKTGDDISLWINLRPDGPYAVQAQQISSTQASIYPPTPPTVTIPRAITSAAIFDVMEGYMTNIAQITLDPAKTPIRPDMLSFPVTTAAYTGPIKLSGSENDQTAPGASIIGVYRVDEAEGYAYRLYLYVTTPGALYVSLPDWGINTWKYMGETKKGQFVGESVYVLDNGGSNYSTLRDAPYQLLLPLQASGAYLAPERELYLSCENTAAAIQHVYVGKEGSRPGEYDRLSEDMYYVYSRGSSPYIFDGVRQPDIKEQRVLRLNQGWTRETGRLKIVVLYGTGPEIGNITAATQAVVDVSGITPTYPLKLTRGVGDAGATALSPDGVPSNIPTTSGLYAAGKKVYITANPEPGWKFKAWEKLSGAAIENIPDEPSTSITMPAGYLELRAVYQDGTAPVTTISPAAVGTVSFTNSGTFELIATDSGVTSSGIINTKYSLNGDAWETYVKGVPVALTREGMNTVQYYSEDGASPPNKENIKTSILYIDTVVPHATVHFNGANETGFDPSPEVIHFYKDRMDFDIPASDPTPAQSLASGIASVRYLITSSSIATTEEALAAPGWKEYDFVAKEKFTITNPGVYYVYAQARDNAGNFNLVNSQGVVIYKDSAPDTKTVRFTKLSGQDPEAKVTLNGNVIAGISRGAYSLIEGTDYDLNATGDAITFKAGYLNSLPIGTYIGSDSGEGFKISYKPQGFPFVSGPSGNQYPALTYMDIVVSGMGSTVVLDVAPSSGTLAYGESATLSAIVASHSGICATGMVTFRDDDGTALAAVSFQPSTAMAGAVAVAGVKLSAGTHSAIRAEYEGDDYYNAGIATMAAYYVKKAIKKAPTITAAAISGGAMTVTYGDEDIRLSAIGDPEDEEGYEWHSDTPTVAAVYSNGTSVAGVLIYNVGEAVITARIKESANFGASPTSAAITLTAIAKPVTISALTVPKRYYDGTDIAKPYYSSEKGANIPGVEHALDSSPPVNGILSDGMSALDAGDPSALDDVHISPGVARFVDGPDAGTGKQVTFAAFGITGSAAHNYRLIGDPPPVSADILKLIPRPAPGAPAVSGIYFGQLAKDAMLTGGATGINDTAIGGTWKWADRDMEAIPGRDADPSVELSPGGYLYEAIFIPDGAAEVNYEHLITHASIHVSPAAVRLAGGAKAVSGSAIFVSSAGIGTDAPHTLADVRLPSASAVICSIGGIETSVVGEWSWSDPAPGDIGYAEPGVATATAIFTPKDRRVAAGTFTVEFPVARADSAIPLDIVTAPSIRPAIYGSRIGDVTFITEPAVVYMNSSGTPSTISGTWSWRQPDQYITRESTISSGGVIKQAAALVFTPELDGDYVDAYAQVDIIVSKAALSIREDLGEAPSIQFGDPLSYSKIGNNRNSGFVFDGPRELNDKDVAGTLAWVNSDTTPSADSGTKYPAIFTPAPEWVDYYEPFHMEVEIVTYANSSTVNALREAVIEGSVSGDFPTAAQALTLLKAESAYDNYDRDAISRLEAAVENINVALQSSNNGATLPQSKAQQLLAQVDSALAGIHSNHEVDPPMSTIRGSDDAAVFFFKGVFTTGTSIDRKLEMWFGKEGQTLTEAELTSGDNNTLIISIGGARAGRISEGTYSKMADIFSIRTLKLPSMKDFSAEAAGSAVVQLDESYLNKLENHTTYDIKLAFTDPYTKYLAYQDNSGNAKLKIERADPPGPGPSPTPEPDPTPTPVPDPTPAPNPKPVPAQSVRRVNITGERPLFKYKASGVGNKIQLGTIVNAVGGAPMSVSWSVSGPARINQLGLVSFTGAEGTVVITARSKFDTSKADSVRIKVIRNVTSIRSPLKAYYIQKGKSMTLRFVLDDSSKKNLTQAITSALKFTSSNRKVLSVDKNGKIKASAKVKKKTKVNITVTAASGARKVVNIYVVPKKATLKKLKVSGYKTKMKVGQVKQMKVSLSPAKATGLTVTYKSSNSSGLYVDKAGKVVALKKGKYTITVKAGGRKVKTKKITVR
jgi:hypothetical protein